MCLWIHTLRNGPCYFDSGASALFVLGPHNIMNPQKVPGSGKERVEGETAWADGTLEKVRAAARKSIRMGCLLGLYVSPRHAIRCAVVRANFENQCIFIAISDVFSESAIAPDWTILRYSVGL